VTCSNCGTENRPGAKFCADCATPLAVSCPGCGSANPPGVEFCSECATPLVPASRPMPPGTLRPAASGLVGPERRTTTGAVAGAERRLTADRLVGRAGIDALEGRGPAALAGYREALRLCRQLGLVFDEAAASVDMATLLAPQERDAPDVATAIAAARETLLRLGARPFLERLDGARTRQPAG